ncbi:ATP-dependent DNA helicase [Trichonephila clavata]|uniref:ATP-dependent DNA helicase n=1 Tax=Trichonephila clavata TaxID=2740835 RepID=A0A8X6HC66_TRICU|nr:ATP-dependent DNA helicase [Trichonephila clavata]
MYSCSFRIVYDEETDLVGCLRDSVNKQDFGMTLKEALTTMFTNHKAGVLIATSKSLGVMNYNDKYYFTDSHACGPNGASASDTYGKACVVECGSLDDLVRVCKRATGSGNVQYTLNYIDVHMTKRLTGNANITTEHNLHQSPQVTYPINISHEVETNLNQATQQYQRLLVSPTITSQSENERNVKCQIDTIPVHTSVMAPIDSTQPTEEQVLDVSNNVNKITRKTTDNIVNVAYERKAEEFAWFFLLPYGVNGLNQPRNIKISPLDYFQYRILGNDTRFQRNDYLFYALSMFEYHRVKSTISACCKKVEGQDGKVDDVHLYLKNLRGSAAYWRTSLNELLAQIRCLGPPTYFLTFSCNDINWLDMRKSLLIADGRPMDNPQDLDKIATQRLIEQYPVIVSRHFMYRFNALMKFMLNNNQVLNNRIKDYWWRIEFQNRGSPHVHMVVWVEGHASFDTEEGLQQLNKVCSCELPPEASELHDLIKKNQLHKHTHTCYKNSSESPTCRFGFPRKECTETRLVSHSSDEFIRNGDRICILKRGPEDGWVNNYNPTLIKVWNANMDIQPCGTNEAIAFYIAKYVSKSEPTQLDGSVARAIREIQREETDISRKLFKVCMRILKERQVSACECAYRLCHLNFRDSSRKCTFLNTRKPEQWYRVLKFDSNGTATGYCSNIIERYEKRPTEHPNYDFDNMCLLEFAMLFEPHYEKSNQEH